MVGWGGAGECRPGAGVLHLKKTLSLTAAATGTRDGDGTVRDYVRGRARTSVRQGPLDRGAREAERGKAGGGGPEGTLFSCRGPTKGWLSGSRPTPPSPTSQKRVWARRKRGRGGSDPNPLRVVELDRCTDPDILPESHGGRGRDPVGPTGLYGPRSRRFLWQTW